MKVHLVAKARGGVTGISRYVRELYCCLKAGGTDVQLVEPGSVKLPGFAEGVLQRRGLDAEAFFTTYPLSIHLNREGIVHLTSQNLATLLWFRHISPVVVTVHDIIPYLLRNDPRLSIYRHRAHKFFDRLALLRLKKADAIIADSRYTGDTLVEHLGIEDQRIHVIHLGVNQNIFRPVEVPDSFLSKYCLNRDTKYIVYVGSEDPRKNLEVLLQGLALVRSERRDVQFLKIGAARFASERQHMLNVSRELNLAESLKFIDQVAEEDLPFFYNLASVFAFPSKYEGFGLPVLEALACGTAVVAAKTSSVPEVVGDAGLLVEPDASQAWAEAILTLLDDPGLAQKMASAGLKRAAGFSWQKTAQQTVEVYNMM